MFGHRYFGARYWGPRYWGPAAGALVAYTLSVDPGSFTYTGSTVEFELVGGGHSGVRRLADAETERRRQVVYQRQQEALRYNLEALRRQAELTAEAQKAAKAVTGKPLAKRTQRKLEKATEPDEYMAALKPVLARLEKKQADIETLNRQLAAYEAMVIEHQRAQFEALLLEEEAMAALAMMM